MINFKGDLRSELDSMDSKRTGGRRGFTYVVSNDTDEWITEAYFGVQFDTGGGEIHGGGKIAPRSTWQLSVDIVPCVAIATGSLWFDKELVKCAEIQATPGYCLLGASWKVAYQKGKSKVCVCLGEFHSAKK